MTGIPAFVKQPRCTYTSVGTAASYFAENAITCNLKNFQIRVINIH
jgi:hypothetical protein